MALYLLYAFTGCNKKMAPLKCGCKNDWSLEQRNICHPVMINNRTIKLPLVLIMAFKPFDAEVQNLQM